MKTLGLFSGIGGFEIAFARAGFETALLVEKDAAARLVLSNRFPGTELLGDVLELRSLPPDTDILCAGFPCQNLSMAGDKSGIRGSKSSVVDHLFRLLEGARVPVVVIENVYFMLHLERGRAMDYLLERFERLDYKWAYRLLDTMAFGLPQRRRRVYLIAAQNIDPRRVLLADDAGPLKPKKPSIDRPIGFYWTEGRLGVGFARDAIPPLKGGSGIGIPSAPAVLFPDGFVGTPSIEIAEKLQGFPSGWSQAASEVRNKLRWKLLGNAVSVPVAEWVARRLSSPGDRYIENSDLLQVGQKWPSAAFNVGYGRYAVNVSTAPQVVKPLSIESFRDQPWVGLSSRAATGFLRRAREGNLKFPDGFLHAIACWIERQPTDKRKK